MAIERFKLAEWRNGQSFMYVVMDVTGHDADGQRIGRILEYGVNSPRGFDDRVIFHFDNGRVEESRSIRSRRAREGDVNAEIDPAKIVDDRDGHEMVMGGSVEWL